MNILLQFSYITTRKPSATLAAVYPVNGGAVTVTHCDYLKFVQRQALTPQVVKFILNVFAQDMKLKIVIIDSQQHMHMTTGGLRDSKLYEVSLSELKEAYGIMVYIVLKNQFETKLDGKPR